MKAMRPIRMRDHLATVPLVLMAVTSMAWPTPVATQVPAEAFAIEHLEMSRTALLAEIEGLSEAQWHFRESPERWSAAEIVEHLALSEDFLFSIVVDQVMQTARREAPLPDASVTDHEVVEMAADRSQQFEAPEPIRPTARFDTPQEAIDHFLSSRVRTIEFARNTPDLRLHVMATSGGIERDALHWTLFISGHTVRHTDQLRQVKRHAEFPRE